VTPRDSATLTVRVTEAGDANHLPVSTDLSFITSKQNQTISFTAGSGPITSTAPVALSATASSGLLVSFSIVGGPARIEGTAMVATNSGVVTVRASQPGNDAFNAAPDVDRTINVALPAPPQPPVILAAPVSRSAIVDAAFTLSVAASGDAPLTYQWSKNGNPIPGATNASFSVARAAPGDAGSYQVDVANPIGSARSGAAIVAVITEAEALASRLVNFSTRAPAGLSDQVAIAGFVISGDRPRPVLIRAVGPTLANFGVTGVVAQPKLELFRGPALVATNSGWMNGGAGAEIAAAAARVGAFALGANTADAALLATLDPGNYTAVIGAADGQPGVGLIEVYDLSEAASGRSISNLSVRALSGAGAETLIVGVVVQGTVSKRLLIRAVGPGLVQFGVSGVLVQPQLAVFADSAAIARNTGWSQSPDAAVIAQASAQVGAFALAAGSADSALIVNLPPGAYTAQVAGAAGAAGVALVEVYELP
jgi:hypothetical protein